MRSKCIMKKAIAVTLGITMAFGALALPVGNAREQFITASAAAVVEIDGVKYTYYIVDGDKVEIIDIETSEETLKIPSLVFLNNDFCTVYMIDDRVLMENKTIKTVVFPETITYIGDDVLNGSSVENITLPKSLEHLGDRFASYCPNLKSFTYKGSNIKPEEMGSGILAKSDISKIVNDKGAVCIGNWLVGYQPGDAEHVKFADLSDNGTKVEYVNSQLFREDNNIKSIDFEGIKGIKDTSFKDFEQVETITNGDELKSVGKNSKDILNTKWYKEGVKTGKVRLGDSLLYYKTDDEVLDLTSGEFAGIKFVMNQALIDSPNIVTVRTTSDIEFASSKLNDCCFYEANKRYSDGWSRVDQFPEDPPIKVKNVFLDGKKLTIYDLEEDPKAKEWLNNSYSFDYSEFTKELVEEKTKKIFEQMDITYYGENNDKVGTLSPTEEFYIRLKVFNYLSMYDYQHDLSHHSIATSMLLSGKCTCEEYALIAHYFLECAGVETKTFFTDPDHNPPDVFIQGSCHFWNATKLGDEWFLSDDGWSAQGDHDYSDFLLSYKTFYYNKWHEMFKSYDSYHFYAESRDTEEITPNRTYGDLNGDEKRNEDDVELMWNHIKGKKTDVKVKKEYADINLDGEVDVTDAVLLDHMVNGKALDVENVPTDGFAPGFWVAFLNGKDYDNIQYLYTDREGYIRLPNNLFEAPSGKKISYDVGMANQKVRITTPLQVVNVKWIDENEPDYSETDSSSEPDKPDGKLGDVNGDGVIDIEDAVSIIQNINGITPLTSEQEGRADVSKDGNIDIDDAVIIISYINGNSTF